MNNNTTTTPFSSEKTKKKQELKNKEIGITEDIKKQNKIGNLFYSMDILLNIMKNKIKILKRYKQGLLQRMFV